MISKSDPVFLNFMFEEVLHVYLFIYFFERNLLFASFLLNFSIASLFLFSFEIKDTPSLHCSRKSNYINIFLVIS